MLGLSRAFLRGTILLVLGFSLSGCDPVGVSTGSPGTSSALTTTSTKTASATMSLITQLAGCIDATGNPTNLCIRIDPPSVVIQSGVLPSFTFDVTFLTTSLQAFVNQPAILIGGIPCKVPTGGVSSLVNQEQTIVCTLARLPNAGTYDTVISSTDTNMRILLKSLVTFTGGAPNLNQNTNPPTTPLIAGSTANTISAALKGVANQDRIFGTFYPRVSVSFSNPAASLSSVVITFSNLPNNPYFSRSYNALAASPAGYYEAAVDSTLLINGFLNVSAKITDSYGNVATTAATPIWITNPKMERNISVSGNSVYRDTSTDHGLYSAGWQQGDHMLPGTISALGFRIISSGSSGGGANGSGYGGGSAELITQIVPSWLPAYGYPTYAATDVMPGTILGSTSSPVTVELTVANCATFFSPAYRVSGLDLYKVNSKLRGIGVFCTNPYTFDRQTLGTFGQTTYGITTSIRCPNNTVFTSLEVTTGFGYLADLSFPIMDISYYSCN